MSTFIGFANDSRIRNAATSGGIGTSLIKYMFEARLIKTAISFNYCKMKIAYEPQIIDSFEEYMIAGSIYHEINLLDFIKKKYDEIISPFCCFALPCQVNAIKYILNKQNISHYIFGLTCSSQLILEATYYLLKVKGIKHNDVERIKYRGDGWPGGINIQIKNGSTVHIPNLNSIWTKIFHSRLFTLDRCFKCNNTLNLDSDVSLADPWLKKYIGTEKNGLTLISCNTMKGEKIINLAVRDRIISVNEISLKIIKESQNRTIARKRAYKKHPKISNIIKVLCKNKYYRKIIVSFRSLFKLHCFVIKYIEYILIKI